MTSTQTTSLGVERDDAGLAVLADRSCGDCGPCAVGARLHCASPSLEARPLTAPVPHHVATALLDALLAAAALVEAPAAGGPVVVVAPETSAVATLVRAVASAEVLIAPDLSDPALRAELSDKDPSGRARVVVAGGDVRAAVRAVRRGGHVCVGDPAAHRPSVTELVQREVSLVGPRDAAAVLARVSPDTWAAAAAAAA